MQKISAFKMPVPLRMIGIETVGIDNEMNFCPIEILPFVFDLALKYFEIARDVRYTEMPDLKCSGGMTGIDCPFGRC